jgi:putative oxidoreductase
VNAIEHADEFPAVEDRTMNDRDRIATALVALRIAVFVVMLMWTLDKFVNVKHASGVFEHFYGLRGFGPGIMAAIGVAELLLILAFVLGYQKRITYGAVLILHGVSTLSSYRQYLDPFNNLLFFAAWPMLAACFALYLLRNFDTKWTVSPSARSTG